MRWRGAPDRMTSRVRRGVTATAREVLRNGCNPEAGRMASVPQDSRWDRVAD
jgi:hypothetical protein